jgi:acetyl-CoA synthetase (ADP-forming)
VNALSKTKEIIATARAENRTFLLEHEAKTIMQEYGVPVTKFGVATSEEEAVQIASDIGAVVLKVLSPDILHKSDAGGVFLNLKTADEVRDAYQQILVNAEKYKRGARITGVIVQEFAKQGVEIIIGSLKDKQFGQTIMFGLGGIFVEVLKDVSFRVAPITTYDAKEMITEIKGYPILTGIRGKEPSDIDAIVNILLQVSKLVTDFPEINQLDLNPVFSYPKGAKCVDARIILEEKT